MNTPKEVFPGFIYMDLEHPLVAWECYRGTLISSYLNASNQVQGASLRTAGLIYSGNNISIANELLFERVRVQFFPSAVSRLRCLYVFGDRISAEAAYNWGAHFKIENLVDVGIGANKVTRADANWITFAERQENGLIRQDYIPYIRNYWIGQPYNNSPHWEFLVDGYAIVWGTEHKKLSYQKIKKEVPNSLGLLEISRIAETMGFYLGHISPQIFRVNERTFKLSYLMDMRDLHDNYGNFIEAFERYKGPVNHQDFRQLFNENEGLKYTVPDLRKYEKEFTLSGQTLYGLPVQKVHSL